MICNIAQANTQVHDIARDLRCLVCNGESIYDSNSTFAIAMKEFIKSEIENGKTPIEIKQTIKGLYGDYIDLSPNFNQYNIILWLAPFILFIIGLLLIVKTLLINRQGKSGDIKHAVIMDDQQIT